MGNNGIRVVLADDHDIVREGLRVLLARWNINVVGEADNGVTLLELARDLRPEVVVADISMPLMNGIEAGAEISRDYEIPCVLMSMHSDVEYVVRAIKRGLAGYVLKSRAAVCLAEAVREVASGNIYFGPGLLPTSVLANLAQSTTGSEVLSGRELQVLQLIAEGHSNKDIAVLTKLSAGTIDSHRGRIMQKLNIHNTAGLVRYALRSGILRDDSAPPDADL